MCVCVRMCESEIPHKMFLLEGRQTAIETVVWHSRKRESESESESERQRGKER